MMEDLVSSVQVNSWQKITTFSHQKYIQFQLSKYDKDFPKL